MYYLFIFDKYAFETLPFKSEYEFFWRKKKRTLFNHFQSPTLSSIKAAGNIPFNPNLSSVKAAGSFPFHRTLFHLYKVTEKRGAFSETIRKPSCQFSTQWGSQFHTLHGKVGKGEKWMKNLQICHQGLVQPLA